VKYRESERERGGPRFLTGAGAIITGAGAGLWALPAAAHAFGQRYDLPLPLDLYLGGAGAAVALSFIIAALFVRRRAKTTGATGIDLAGTTLGRVVMGPVPVAVLQALSLALFALVLAAGFLGTDSTTKNFAPTFVWVVWWVGMAYVAALLCNLWDLVCPWAILHRWFIAPRRKTPPRAYPTHLGAWPAVVLFALFAWLETVSEAGEQPAILAGMVSVYCALMLAGMARYGATAWLRQADAFSVAFGLMARFAVVSGRLAEPRHLVLRPPGAGLLEGESVSQSMTSFVLLMLATVSYDGFVETSAWAAIVSWVGTDMTLRPALIDLQDAGIDLLKLLKTLALVSGVLLFHAVYWMFATLVDAFAGRPLGIGETARAFVLTLVPIAIAYHLAHYLSYLLLAGQLVIPLASDPFGWGWDLFGTAGHAMNIGIIGPKDVWYLSVGAIVIGHVVAVYLAHVIALRLYEGARAAILSQLPMLVLMVGYTMTSLWILSQPIVE